LNVLIILLIGIWVFRSKRKHLLATLLILEFIVLRIFTIFFINLSIRISYFSLIYLTITACEAALGLTILVSIRRVYGGDYFKSFHLEY